MTADDLKVTAFVPGPDAFRKVSASNASVVFDGGVPTRPQYQSSGRSVVQHDLEEGAVDGHGSPTGAVDEAEFPAKLLPEFSEPLVVGQVRQDQDEVVGKGVDQQGRAALAQLRWA